MPHKISLKECAIVELPTFTDSRGSLSLVDSDTAAKLLPFKPERVFWIHGTEEHTIRGQHAHRSCWELVVAVSGSFSLTLNDGKNDKTFLLDSPQRGVIIWYGAVSTTSHPIQSASLSHPETTMPKATSTISTSSSL